MSIVVSNIITSYCILCNQKAYMHNVLGSFCDAHKHLSIYEHIKTSTEPKWIAQIPEEHNRNFVRCHLKKLQQEFGVQLLTTRYLKPPKPPKPICTFSYTS